MAWCAEACSSGAQASHAEALLAGLAGLHAPLLAQAGSPQCSTSALPDSAGVESFQWLAAPVQAVPPLAGSAAAAPRETLPAQVTPLMLCYRLDMLLSCYPKAGSILGMLWRG